MRLDVRKTENLKSGDEVYGSHVKIKVVKNKVAPPFRVAEFDMLYGKGISKSSEIIEVGVALDVIQKSGSWFSYAGDRIGQGKDRAREYLEEHPDLMNEVEEKIKEAAKERAQEEDPEGFSSDDEDERGLRDDDYGKNGSIDEEDGELDEFGMKLSDIEGE